MNTGKMLFAQIMDHLPWKTFHRVVSRYGGDSRIRTLPCAEHFRVMAFAQLTYRESPGDIEACLSAQSAKARWQVELFFKWIKQHLRIKPFYGTSQRTLLLSNSICSIINRTVVIIDD